MSKHGFEVVLKTGDFVPAVYELASSNGCLNDTYDEEEEYSGFIFDNAEDAIWFYINVRDSVGYVRIDPVNIETYKGDA